MANVGDTINLSAGIASGVAPGQGQYKTGAGATKIIGTRNVGGTNYYNIDQTGIGGGTGWVAASSIDSQAAPAPAPSTPTSPNQVDGYLNGIQDNAFSTANSPEIKVQSIDEITKSIQQALPTDRPTIPSLVDTFKGLSTSYGLDTLDTQIQDIQKQITDITGGVYASNLAEGGKPVVQSVMEGRIGQEQRNALIKAQPLQDQLKTLTTLYTSKLTTVQNIVDLTGKDYANAVQDYNDRYTQAINMITTASGIQRDQFTEAQAIQANARADLQVYVNTIKDGNLDINSLNPAQQVQLNKLEVQAGLPVGFISSLKADAKAQIMFTSESNGITQVGLRNPDGTISVQSYGTSTKTPTEKDLALNDQSNIIADFKSVAGKDGYVSPQNWGSIKRQALEQTNITASQFDDKYGFYKNPQNNSYQYYDPGA